MSSDTVPANLLGKIDLIEKIHTEKNMLELTEEQIKQHGACNKNEKKNLTNLKMISKKKKLK